MVGYKIDNGYGKAYLNIADNFIDLETLIDNTE